MITHRIRCVIWLTSRASRSLSTVVWEALAAVTGSDADGHALLADQEPDTALARAIERWRARIAELPQTGRLAAWEAERGVAIVSGGA